MRSGVRGDAASAAEGFFPIAVALGSSSPSGESTSLPHTTTRNAATNFDAAHNIKVELALQSASPFSCIWRQI